MTASQELPFEKMLRRLMDQRHLGVEELARCAEVHTKTVYDWLKGSSRPRPERMVAVARCLDVDVRELGASVYIEAREKVLANGPMSEDEIRFEISRLQALLDKKIGEDE